MIESAMWRRVRDGLGDAAGERPMMLQRVENYAGRSTPDVYFALPGGSGWIELKMCRSDRTTVKWQPGQVSWNVRAREIGVKAYVLVGRLDQRRRLALYLFRDAVDLAHDGIDAAPWKFLHPIAWDVLLEVLEHDGIE